MSSKFYDFNQRVHLRRDPSQFGTIGRGPFNQIGGRTGTDLFQFVFWESKDSDMVTCENLNDLLTEEEMHDSRRLFFSVIRRPEMRLLRLALLLLKRECVVACKAVELYECFPDARRLEFGVVC